MKRSERNIRTSHGGRLPYVTNGSAANPPATEATLPQQVAAVIKKQMEIGINCIGDGELWNGRDFLYYGRYLGVTLRDVAPGERATSREMARERDEFPKLYGDMDRVGTAFCVPGEELRFTPAKQKMIASGPFKRVPAATITREIDVFNGAIEAAGGIDEGFVCVPSPGWLDHFIFNEHYGTEEAFVFGLAGALHEEYRAVVDAGFILQIDDPGIVSSWDMIRPKPTIAEYRRYLKLRVEALNHALAGIPEDRVRLHFCWGSWHGAHTHDLPLKEVVDLILQVNTQTYSFEAGNVRHEHEWAVWKNVGLPAGKILMPGVISHATNIVEHPELVAQRIQNFANAVGRENVIAGTDCGLGTRLHDELVWAKLAALVEGARLASKALWSR